MKFAQKHASTNTGTLRNHYREVHEHKWEARQAGPNKRHLQDDLVRWYSLFAGRISHNWSPRKAKHRGFYPELGSRPSIQPLLPTGPPTPLYGPGARVRATSSRRPRHDQECDSATDFEGFQDDDDDADRESAAAAATKPDAAPLRTEVRGETSPSELRAARRGKQKATRTQNKTSRGHDRGRSGSGSLGYLQTPQLNESNAGPSRLHDAQSRISKHSNK